MKRRQFILRLCPTVIAGAAGFELVATQPARAANSLPVISVSPAMVINEIAQGDATLLIDEQHIDGDPAAGSGGTPVTTWSPGNTAFFYPAGAVIDLGTECHLEAIYLYDADGAGDVLVATGDPIHWDVQFTDPMVGAGTWNRHVLDAHTRYIRVVLTTPVAPRDIVVYGTRFGVPEPPPKPVPHARPLLDHFVGVNGFIDDPLDILSVAGHIREYHNWVWDEDGNSVYPHSANAWNPSAGNADWDFDAYYSALHGRGIEVCPVVQGCLPWLAAKPGDFADKPVPAGADPADPASYAAHADHMFQYAARYGETKVPDSLLKLRDDQPRVSGLGTVKHYENWNEPNGTWSGPAPWFRPAEFAAMCSADYDGHMGTMGRTVGVKNADPQAKLIMAGLSGVGQENYDLEFIRAMKLWADFHRNGEFPADVINLHAYSTAADNSTGVSPEAFSLRERAAAVVAYRDRYLPRQEIWISEFGYDTNQGSPRRAPTIADYSAEEVQGQWLVRSYLALAAAGVDRAQMYMIRDVNGDDPTQYSSSGLVTSKETGEKPKTSWYYVYTLRSRLGRLRFADEQSSDDPRVRIYRFENPAGKNGAYAVWCPTSDGTTVAGHNLKFGRGMKPGRVRLVELAAGNINGTETAVPIRNRAVRLDVSERPVFVLVDDISG